MTDSGGNRRHWWPRPLRIPITATREADRRAGETLISLLDQAGKAEIETMIARGEYIPTIRRVRELTGLPGLRLIDARRIVDSIRR